MNARLLATPLVAATLLLSTLGCSKKDDPTARSINTGTYTLDGVVTPCQVTVGINSNGADYLYLRLTPTDPQRTGELVFVYFSKPLGTPFSAYVLTQATLSFSKSSAAYILVYKDSEAKATLNQLSSGGYSGTFSATSTTAGTQVITAGAFTDVRP